MRTGGEPRAAQIRRIGQIVLGALWLIDGALQLQPVMFGKTFVTGVTLPNAAGQPTVVASPIVWVAHQIEPHVALFNAVAASLQVLIGLGLMAKRTVKFALAVSFLWSLAIWIVGEGLGGILSATADPLTGAPGAALLYIAVGIMVWPRQGDGVRGGRLAWAALWSASAALWLLPANDRVGSVHDAIASAPSGDAASTGVLHTAANLAAGGGTVIAVAMCALSTAIAISILAGAAQRTFLGLAIVLSVMFWILGQGLGGLLTGGATDVSTGPLVVLMASILLAQASPRGPTRAPSRQRAPRLGALRPHARLQAE